MTLRPLQHLFPIALAAVLTAAPGVRAQVEDEAGLFGADTVAKANRQIEDLRKQTTTGSQTGKGLIIATIKKAPEELKQQFNMGDVGQVREYFEAVCSERLRGRTFDGVYVLICQEPKYIHVSVIPETSKGYFTKTNRDILHSLLVKRIQLDNSQQGWLQKSRNALRSARPDRGLLEAVDYVSRKLDWNRPADMSRWYGAVTVLVVLLGVWSCLLVARARLRKKTPRSDGIQGVDESGVSIAVLGGGVGAVVGEYLAGSLARRLRRRTEAATPPTEPATEEPPMEGTEDEAGGEEMTATEESATERHDG